MTDAHLRPQSAVAEDTGPTGAVGIHGPSIWVASAAPGQGGIVMHRNRSACAPVHRYWKPVPTGMSLEGNVRRSLGARASGSTAAWPARSRLILSAVV
jgi:hypothetical protein